MASARDTRQCDTKSVRGDKYNPFAETLGCLDVIRPPTRRGWLLVVGWM